MDGQTKVVFREVQRVRQIWLWLLTLSVAFLFWYGMIQQVILGETFGDKPVSNSSLIILWAIFGVVFPVVMLGIMRLIIVVRNDGIYIRFAPFHVQYRKFLFKDITSYEKITYNSLQRFWGWGIRVNTEGETAYNMSGKEGMKLNVNNNTVIIGTRKSDELKRAMDLVQEKN